MNTIDKASPSDVDLTEKDKSAVAWIFAANGITWGITIFLAFAMCAWAIITLYSYLYTSGLSHHLWGSILLICVIGIFMRWLMDYKNTTYSKLFDVSPSCWIDNTGTAPDLSVGSRVNVEYENGHIVWNKPVRDFDWSWDIKNPIKTYFIK